MLSDRKNLQNGCWKSGSDFGQHLNAFDSSILHVLYNATTIVLLCRAHSKRGVLEFVSGFVAPDIRPIFLDGEFQHLPLRYVEGEK